jgi:hypothetical protein
VKVTGIPGISSIDYDGWKLRRRNEFESKLLRSLTYQLGAIQSAAEDEIRFAVEETMKASSGRVIVIDKEVTLRREADGRWRVRHEHFGRIRQR